MRNPRIDIFDIPELPASITEGDITYHAKVDSATRVSCDLHITEVKTGSYVGMADHYLQTWAYCLPAPSSLYEATNRNFRAKEIQWQLVYPKAGKNIGPYPFTKKMLNLVRNGMHYYSILFKMGKSGVTRVPGESATGPTSGKCRACAFSHSYIWRILS